MIKVSLLFLISLGLAAGPGLSSAQVAAIPEVQEASSTPPPPPARKKKGRRKPLRIGSVSADDPVIKEPAPAPAAEKAPKPVEPRRVNALLFGTMEKLETLDALYENLRLQVSGETLEKISELEKAAGRVAADYFKVEAPSPDREDVKTYRGLIGSALKSVKALKDVKDRVKPGESEAAVLLCRDLNAAIDEELAGAKLTAPAPAAEPAGQEQVQAAPAEAPVNNEAAALDALSEVRKALKDYKAKEDKYPKNLAKLAPKYIPAVPEIQLADHPATREVMTIDSSDYDDAVFQAITDTGKWLYFTDKRSKYYGLVMIDCSHKNSGGVELYKIGQGN